MESAFEEAGCPHCELLPIHTLRSRRALFEEGVFVSAPHGAGPASAQAERWLHSWGSQLDLAEGLETGKPLSLSSPARSTAHSLGSEARSAVSSPQRAGPVFHLSPSEEEDVESTGFSPTLSPQYEELLEVVTRAVAKLNINWPADDHPGHLNVGADILSRQGPRPGEWRLHPEVVKQIWRVFGQAQVDLFATRQTSHCPLWYSLTHPAPLGLDAMVQTWPRLRLYAFPPIALLPGVLERMRRDGVRLLLVAPFWPGRVWFSDLISLPDGSPWEISVRRDLLSQAEGMIFHPRPELWKLWTWPLRGRDS